MSFGYPLVRADITDLVRSNLLWILTGLLVLLVFANWAADPTMIDASSQSFLLVLLQFTHWLPLFAIVIGYDAVVRLRESGRVRLLLGQPTTRRTLVIQAFLARVIAFLAVLSAAILVVLVLVVTQTGSVGVLEFVAGVGSVALYGLAWLGATVGVSAMAASGRQVIGVMLIAYTLLLALWEPFVARVLALAVTGSGELGGLIEFADPAVVTYAEGATWFLYAFRLGPAEAFTGTVFYSYEVLQAAVDGGSVAVPHGPNLFGVGVLLAWLALPLLVGSWLFQRVDLE